MRADLLLVVEDDEADRAALCVALREHGFHVLEASEGSEALRILRQRPVGLVVLDLGMPGMDGYELLEKLVGSKLERIPVIVVSGHAYTSRLYRASGYMRKPIRSMALVDTVRRCLPG